MALNKVEADFCRKVTEKLYYSPLARLFLEPVDPVRDGCPNYSQIVKQPMDLGTVSEKLTKKNYKSTAEWRADVMQIWKNAMLYNPKGTPVHALAQKLEKKTIKLTKSIPKTETELWHLDLVHAARKVSKILQFNPPSAATLRPTQPKPPGKART
jgi:hypothetical protein